MTLTDASGTRIQSRFINFSLALMLVVSTLATVLSPFVSQVSATSAVSYIATPFTSSELLNWSVDRALPTGHYSSLSSFVGNSDVLKISIDKDLANMSGTGFYQTEGLQRQIPASGSIKVDLYVDSDWTINSKTVRAGIWGVGRDVSNDISAYPIVEFTTDGFTGWRTYDSNSGQWNTSAATYNLDGWNNLEINHNPSTGMLDYYINGSYVHSYSDNGTTKISAVILNSKNYGPLAQSYDVHWSNFVYGNDTSSTQFVNDPKYVRVNNASDLSAQIVTPDTTQDVRFYIDGNTTPLNGSNVGGAGATTNWWRLYTALSAGEHTVTADVKIDGQWYSVADYGIVYSIDNPTASYILPSATQNNFRPSDNPIRIKAEDEFKQFKSMNVKIGSQTFTVLREDCDLRQEGNYVLCDVDRSSTWAPLLEGSHTAVTTTYTYANNRVDNLTSQTFIIDGTAPTVTNLQIESNPGSSLIVSANAQDNRAVESVNFYVTTPRVNDGACTGLGIQLVSQRVLSVDVDGKYRVDLDVSTLDGDYCVTAVSRDKAFNNSVATHKKVSIDNTAPTISLVSPSDNSIVRGSSLTQSWSSTSTDVHHYIYESYHNQTMTSPRWNENMGTSTSKTATNVSDAVFWWRVKAVDNAGNETWSELRKLTIDNTAPDVEITSPTAGYVSGTVDIRGTVTDANPHHYFLKIERKVGASWSQVYSHIYNETASFTDMSLYNWTPSIDGEYRITLEARDATGGTQNSGNKDSGSVDSVIVTVDNTSPTLTIVSPLDNTDTTPTLTGVTSDPSRPVDVEIDGITYPAIVNPDGTWSVTTGVLAVGSYTATATTTDSAGNTTTETQDFAIVAVLGVTSPAVSPASTPESTGSTFSPLVATNNVSGNSDTTSEVKDEAKVLAESTIDTNSDANATSDDATEEDTNGCSQFLGLCWYWWVPIAIVVAGIAYWLFRPRSREV